MARALVALIALLPLCTSLPAVALDLTGTWTGRFVCSEFDGAKGKFPEDATLLISQNGNDLNILWVDVGNYSGVAIPDQRKPDAKGEAKMVECDTDADMFDGYDELARLRAKVNRNRGSGSLKGESFYAPNAPVAGLVAGSCKWSFKRTDTADPAAGACP